MCLQSQPADSSSPLGGMPTRLLQVSALWLAVCQQHPASLQEHGWPLSKWNSQWHSFSCTHLLHPLPSDLPKSFTCRDCVTSKLSGPGIVESKCPQCGQPAWQHDLQPDQVLHGICEVFRAHEAQGVPQKSAAGHGISG